MRKKTGSRTAEIGSMSVDPCGVKMMALQASFIGSTSLTKGRYSRPNSLFISKGGRFASLPWASPIPKTPYFTVFDLS